MTGHDIHYTSLNCRIKGFTKTQQHRTTGRAEQWAFDNCRHFTHQFCSGVGINDAGAQGFVQFTPGGTAGVKQCLPAQLGNKVMQLRALKAIGAVIVEAVLDVVRFQPAAGFFDGIAIFNAVTSQHR